MPETPIKKMAKYPEEPALIASKIAKILKDPLIPAPPISPISKFEPTEAFHSGLHFSRSQKHQAPLDTPPLKNRTSSSAVPVKPKLLTVPAEKLKVAETSANANEDFQAQRQLHDSCQEPSRSDHQLLPPNRFSSTDLIPIPAICIPTPTKLICQFELPSHTRSIGIQVDLQQASDIKIM